MSKDKIYNELLNIKNLYDRKQNINELVNLINNINGDDFVNNKEIPNNINNKYELKFKGTFMEFENICEDILKNMATIKEFYELNIDKKEASKKIKKKYLDKYYVEYQFIGNDGKIVYIDYMKPYSDSIPFIKYLTIKFNGCVCEIQHPIFTDDFFTYRNNFKPISMPHKFNESIKLGVLNDFLYIDNISSIVRGKGYMNIVMCLAAYFCLNILKKKYFFLHVGAFSRDMSDKKLREEIYPSFGFIQSAIKRLMHNKDAMMTINEMHANMEDIINLNKCIQIIKN